MPARSTPVGASSETISGDIEGYAPRERRANKCGRHPMLARSSEAIAVNLECRAVHHVRFWHKETSRDAQRMSAFAGIADIAQASENVRSSDLGTSAT